MWSGLLAGAALPLGAAAGLFLKLPQRAVAGVMAFGAGTLITALALVLMEDAYQHGGLWTASIGFLAGAAAYTIVDTLLHRWLGRRRKPTDRAEQSGLAIAVGSLIDNVPEGLVIGIGAIGASSVNPALLAAVFLSNFPEALSSAARMKEADHQAGYVLGIWSGIGVLTGLAALGGYAAFSGFTDAGIAAASAVAAGRDHRHARGYADSRGLRGGARL